MRRVTCATDPHETSSVRLKLRHDLADYRNISLSHSRVVTMQGFKVPRLLLLIMSAVCHRQQNVSADIILSHSYDNSLDQIWSSAERTKL